MTRPAPLPAPKAERTRLRLAHSAAVAEQNDRARQRRLDAAAFDRVCGKDRPNKPLKPPPMPEQPEFMTAARRALSRDRRLGAFRDVRFFGVRS